MSPVTTIEWTDRAWPVVNGCRRVSPGCKNCWAERLTATRLRHHPRYEGLAVYTDNGPRWTGEQRLAIDVLQEPLRVRTPARWFVANKGDLFGDGVSDEQIAAVFGVMAARPQHTFQVLTKRAERLAQWFAREVDHAGECSEAATRELWDSRAQEFSRAQWPVPNVWVGVSVEDQQRAEERIPALLSVPGAAIANTTHDDGYVRWAALQALAPLVAQGDVEARGAAIAVELCGVPVMDADDPHLRKVELQKGQGGTNGE